MGGGGDLHSRCYNAQIGITFGLTDFLSILGTQPGRTRPLSLDLDDVFRNVCYKMATSLFDICPRKIGVSFIGLISIILAMLSYLRVRLDPHFDDYMHLLPIVYVVSGILLIVGAEKKKWQFVFPPLSIYFTSIVLFIPMDFIRQFRLAVITGDGGRIAAVPLIGILFALIDYFSKVIYTHYQEVLEKEYSIPDINPHDNGHPSNQRHE